MSKAVVCYSGGMDSTVLLFSAKEEHSNVLALSFAYGQKHRKELEVANTVAKQLGVTHKVINISFFKEVASVSSLTNSEIPVAKARDVMGDPQTVNYVPFRNIMLLSIACATAESWGADVVYHGAAQADSVAGYWDGSPEFIQKMNELTILNRRHKIHISAPLLDKSKEQIIKLGTQLGVDFKQTWTCYEGVDLACGQCTACSLRLQGFILAGIRDPIQYQINIPWESAFNQTVGIKL